MVRNFKITVAYDGQAYHGWQRQKNAVTIQGKIESAIEKLTGCSVPLIGSGRTDAGVHALGQVANFKCDTRLPPEVLERGLTSLLPPDIVVTGCERVPDPFHARYAVKRKRYLYRILNHKVPPAVGRQYVWHIPHGLDLNRMQASLACFKGTLDFKSFEAAGSPRSHTVRTVNAATLILKNHGILHFEIEADGFLRHMVRNIVGTLVAVGTSRMSHSDLEKLFLARDRRLAPPTAPAHGLFLKSVSY